VSENGRFAVLALDHRDSLRQFLEPEDPDRVSGSELTMLKRMIVDGVGMLATGVMLEPEYSIPQVSDVLPPPVGFFAALEAQGYLGDPAGTPTRILDGWSVGAAVASGAAVLKLLVHYHPDASNAPDQVAFAGEVVAEARRHDASIVLEPLFHSLAGPEDRERVVLATVEHFAGLQPDLLKLPFPVDPVAVPSRPTQLAACAGISARSPMPWAMLSGGGSFGAFIDQLGVAMESGASGCMVGRALWGDAVLAPVDTRQEMIDTLVRGRMMGVREAVGL